MPWKNDVEYKDNGNRYVADVFEPDYGEGGQEIRLKRKLAPNEVWPPPKAPVDNSAALAAAKAEQEARDGIVAALLGEGSHLDPAAKSQLRRETEWRKKVGA